MVGWLLVGCCNAGDSSDVTLAFGDAKAILHFPSEETDDKDDTDDTYNTVIQMIPMIPMRQMIQTIQVIQMTENMLK